MNIKRPLLPGFLKKLDDHLLLHKPDIWSARTHLVWYYGILFMVLLALVTCIVPDDPREASSSDIWAGFVCILSVIGLVAWLIYLLRFNVFKRYGIIKPGGRLVVFLLYFSSAVVITLFPYVQPFMESVRANRAYGNEEIVRDINAINFKVCQLEYDSLRHDWHYDTLKFVALGPAAVRPPADYYDAVTEQAADHRPNYVILDTSAKKLRLAQADSLRQVSDSEYIVYQCPQYTFLSTYDSDQYSTIKEYGSEDIYKKLILNYTPPDKEKAYTELKALLGKYDRGRKKHAPYYQDYDYAESAVSNNYIQQIQKKYNLGDVSESLRNIIQRKYRWAPHRLSDHLHILYYFALSISLLVFIFRHTTTRTFFLSLLTGVLLMLFTALLIAFSGFRDSEFMGLLLFYFLLFFGISLWTWKTKTRSIIIGISINLFVFLIPFIPLLGVSFYYALLRLNMRMENYPGYDTEAMTRHLSYAEIAGGLLLLILIGTYIQALYRRWYALPEE